MTINSNSNIKNNTDCITNRYYIIKCLNHANEENTFDILDKYPYVIDFILCILSLYDRITIRESYADYRDDDDDTVSYLIYTDYRQVSIEIYINVYSGLICVTTDFKRTYNSNIQNHIIKQFTNIIKDKQCQIESNDTKNRFIIKP